jgi:tetratricopeptide (TPR) repeat protein
MRQRMNFKLMTYAACSTLILFTAGLRGQVEKGGSASSGVQSSKAANVTPSFMEGYKLSPQEVSELEDIVAKDPDNLEAQSRLLSYYYTHAATDRILRPKQERIVLWLIQNHPEATVLSQLHGLLLPKLYNYAEGEKLWNNQLQKYPDNLKVISNACSYFQVGNIDYAIECYKRGKSLDPENTAEWDRKLGNSYNSKMASSPAEEKPLWAKEALIAYESAYAESKPKTFSYNIGGSTRTVAFPDMFKGVLLPSIAKAALAAGELDKAAKYANQMLETAEDSSFYTGDYIYTGNSILGLVAVHEGNPDAAETYLLQAGETPGSPGLNSFGPDMSLAKELMNNGRRDSVLAFLRKCQKFWRSSEVNHLSQWIQEMEEGKTPDFDQVRHELERRIQSAL